MTRTARSAFPRAVSKDRSESKSGLDKSIRKGGAGAHSWGSLADEGYLEAAALEDEELEHENDSKSDSESSENKQSMTRSVSSLSEEDVKSAKQFRKNALKIEGLDLASIARTSAAASTSPVKAVPQAVIGAADMDQRFPIDLIHSSQYP